MRFHEISLLGQCFDSLKIIQFSWRALSKSSLKGAGCDFDISKSLKFIGFALEMITVQNLKYRLLPFFPLPIKKFSFDIRAPCSFGARPTFCFNRQLDSSEDRAALQQRAITIKLSNMILIFISRSQELQMLFHVPVTILLLGRCLY